MRNKKNKLIVKFKEFENGYDVRAFLPTNIPIDTVCENLLFLIENVAIDCGFSFNEILKKHRKSKKENNYELVKKRAENEIS